MQHGVDDAEDRRVAPIPSASVRIATSANPGDRRRVRAEDGISCHQLSTVESRTSSCSENVTVTFMDTATGRQLRSVSSNSHSRTASVAACPRSAWCGHHAHLFDEASVPMRAESMTVPSNPGPDATDRPAGHPSCAAAGCCPPTRSPVDAAALLQSGHCCASASEASIPALDGAGSP